MSYSPSPYWGLRHLKDQLIAALERGETVKVDCGRDSFREFSTEFSSVVDTAKAVMECAECAPYICCDNAGECDCVVHSFDRVIFE